jgi:chitinase
MKEAALVSRLRASLVALALLAGASCEALPNVPPSAAFIFSPVSPIAAGSTAVVFNAATSSDSDGQITSYSWNFGDGTPPLMVSEPATSHVFPNTAATCIQITYAVLLTVVDNGGARHSASQVVSVTEDCPR